MWLTAGGHTVLCSNLAIGSTNPRTWSIPMAAAKKSSRSKGGRKRAGSSGRSRGGARKRSSGRKSGGARKSSRGRSSSRKSSSSRRKGGARKSSRRSSSRSSGRKSGGRKSGGRKSSSARKSSGRKRRRTQSPVARVKRVATGVVQQAAGLGERAVDTVTEFVQDRF
jgi:hypothetical protein